MIDRRLTRLIGESRKYIILNVLMQWISLCANIVMMYGLSVFLSALFQGIYHASFLILFLMTALGALFIRYLCTRGSRYMSYRSSATVKSVLREKIFRKLLKLGPAYQEMANTAELIQTAVEGVDQLETYFGMYLPQFFYAMLAPLTLFAVLAFVDLTAAFVLLIMVPAIPMAIVIVQKRAKKLLNRYWDKYTNLGDSFLENLQGLTTLKIYQTDGIRNEMMNEDAEKFRKATMNVLKMQLNSVTIMDVMAYGGAALGIIVAVLHLNAGTITLSGCLFVILISADFFLPMRTLGSYFHTAMNGMAASDRIFRFLETEEEQTEVFRETEGCEFRAEHLSFSYDGNRKVPDDVSFSLGRKGLTGICGKSGSGKSTLAKLLCGRLKGYEGSLKFGSHEIREIDEGLLSQMITYVPSAPYFFKGTVRENLLMADPKADDEMIWDALRLCGMDDFLREREGLDTVLLSGAANLSGGQAQRLASARALLHHSPVMIFDEVTSNIDAESEEIILKTIRMLAADHSVIMISHRLSCLKEADVIFVMDQGKIAERGSFSRLKKNGGLFAEMESYQRELEEYGKAGEVYVKEAC